MENEEVLQETENPVEEQPTVEVETEGEDLSEKLTKAEEIAKNQRIRAEKAEKELKALKGKPAEVTPKNEEVTLSPKDYLSLTENKISSEDFDEVVKISKVLGKSITDTLKDKTTKVILSQRAEERASAEATATSSQRQRVKTASDEDIVNNATSGKIPDNPEDLVKAELALKKKRAGIKD